MTSSSLQQQKKELQHLEQSELMELCLRLARYKKENKELLNYLLFHSKEPMAYAETVKNQLQADFEALPSSVYYCTKSLRKILRQLSRQVKYMAKPEAEMELLIWFCNNYVEKVAFKKANKALQNIFIRQVDKMKKLIAKMHEDLQFDYQQEIEKLDRLAQQLLD